MHCSHTASHSHAIAFLCRCLYFRGYAAAALLRRHDARWLRCWPIIDYFTLADAADTPPCFHATPATPTFHSEIDAIIFDFH
jgi:hypothetical protein